MHERVDTDPTARHDMDRESSRAVSLNNKLSMDPNKLNSQSAAQEMGSWVAGSRLAVSQDCFKTIWYR